MIKGRQVGQFPFVDQGIGSVERLDRPVDIALHAVEVAEVVVNVRQVEGMAHLLGDAQRFLAVRRGFLELAALGQGPDQPRPGYHGGDETACRSARGSYRP